jgi:hypothetical protein
MSRGDYYQKKAAAVLVGRALEKRGWKLYGWRDNRSDPMTDYYDPESWRGVAVKDGFVACVNVSAYDAESLSGQPEVKLVPVKGDSCPRCSGSGEDPLAWTLEEARQAPALYNTDRLRAEHLDALDRADAPSQSVRLASGTEIRWLLPTVSPLQFTDAGRMKCAKCHGQGHLWAQPRTEVLFNWPQFQANPRGRTWHVEKDGRLLASGTGLNRCGSFQGGAAAAAVEEIADRIDAVTRAHPDAQCGETPGAAAPAPGPDQPPALTVNKPRNGLELRFSGKPSDEIRAEMKGHGWRWSRFGGCWYHRDTAANRAFAEALILRLTPEKASA